MLLMISYRQVFYTGICRGDIYQKENFMDFGHLGKFDLTDKCRFPIIPGNGAKIIIPHQNSGHYS